ncbi:MAG: hypothetical protein GKR77_06380 [Legionellales bacterium]|nr:hypothetical protein [Legionellales bacterium]
MGIDIQQINLALLNYLRKIILSLQELYPNQQGPLGQSLSLISHFAHRLPLSKYQTGKQFFALMQCLNQEMNRSTNSSNLNHTPDFSAVSDEELCQQLAIYQKDLKLKDARYSSRRSSEREKIRETLLNLLPIATVYHSQCEPPASKKAIIQSWIILYSQAARDLEKADTSLNLQTCQKARSYLMYTPTDPSAAWVSSIVTKELITSVNKLLAPSHRSTHSKHHR